MFPRVDSSGDVALALSAYLKKELLPPFVPFYLMRAPDSSLRERLAGMAPFTRVSIEPGPCHPIGCSILLLVMLAFRSDGT